MFYSHGIVLSPASYEPGTVINALTDTFGFSRALIHIKNGNITLGTVQINDVPYCCGMLFINNLTTFIRNQGHAKRLFDTVDKFARLGGYSAVQCVIPGDCTRTQNKWLHDLFIKHGYVYLKGSRVLNSRSGNYLYTYQKVIK